MIKNSFVCILNKTVVEGKNFKFKTGSMRFMLGLLCCWCYGIAFVNSERVLLQSKWAESSRLCERCFSWLQWRSTDRSFCICPAKWDWEGSPLSIYSKDGFMQVKSSTRKPLKNTFLLEFLFSTPPLWHPYHLWKQTVAVKEILQ